MIPSGLSWEDILHPLYQKYKNHITWGDQDLLNIIFHYNPGEDLFSCISTLPAMIMKCSIIRLKTHHTSKEASKALWWKICIFFADPASESTKR